MAGANFVKLNGKCINSTKPDQLLFSIEITRTVNRLIFGHQSCLFYSMFMFSRVFNKVRSRLWVQRRECRDVVADKTDLVFSLHSPIIGCFTPESPS